MEPPPRAAPAGDAGVSVLVRPGTDDRSTRTAPGRSAPGESSRADARTRAWWLGLVAVGLAGLGIRIGTVLGRPHRVPGGDAYYYHNAANLLVAGQGFIDPWRYFGHNAHHHVQTAYWPPLFVVILAAVSLVGFKSFFAHRIWCCVIGAAAVVAAGAAGRRIAGPKVGLIAAFLVAVYPNIWMSDELGLSECLSPLLVALILLAAYRFWARPRWSSAVTLGVAMGLATLARDELALLVPFILVPLALLAKLSWRRRLALAGTGTLVALVVVAPWVGFNMSRFQKPVFISNGFGITLASANCDTTYSGSFEGYWSLKCALAAHVDPNADESVRDARQRAHALHYIRTHEGRLLPVELARMGRAFGAFHPMWQIRLDAYIETRPYHWAVTGLVMYYALAALAVGGTVVLRRRRTLVFPLWAVGLDVVASVLVTFGQTRYRTTFEVCLVLLASVQLEWLGARLARALGRLRPRRARLAAASSG